MSLDIAPTTDPVNYPGDGPFVPDVPVPVAFSPPDSPELALCRAVLEDAVKIVRGPIAFGTSLNANTCSSRVKWLETRGWFESTDDSWPFSFEAIASVLGLDAGMVRKRVLG